MKIIVILHNVRSMHNVGSIFRTADAAGLCHAEVAMATQAGVEKIYLCGITPKPVDRLGEPRPQLTKVSLGAEKTVSWEYARRTADVIKKLRADGYKVFAVEQSKNSIPYYKISKFHIPNSKFCLILGNEVSGLPPSILKLADKVLEIPMRGGKESLNVSVAFGIVVFRLLHPI